jgi:hypothetical protein
MSDVPHPNAPTPVPAAVPGSVAPDDQRPHAEPSDTEEIYFEGSPPIRGLGMTFILWVLIGIVLIAVPIVTWAMSKHMPMPVAAGFIVAGLIAMFVPALMVKTKRFRISNYRIDYERGLLSKTIDTLELWHVEDIHFHQSLLDRILDVGSITVLSRDETTPRLFMKGIPHPRPLYEALKQRVIAVKRSRGVIKMDPG